ncbi:hypothetical protein C5167_021176 [Papaver somniferum]|uniref:Uncharacterized protein n=1 Tax=Papaver somniferum TaxID=3469 RepID=A0A4Y7IV58_PAPSO|nr:hypothetical protein C5167_021176 [Papaver somniferum]
MYNLRIEDVQMKDCKRIIIVYAVGTVFLEGNKRSKFLTDSGRASADPRSSKDQDSATVGVILKLCD